MRKRFFIVLGMVITMIGASLVVGRLSMQRRAQSIQCGNHMVSIECAALMWANDHDDRLPPDLIAMSNELVSPRILHCPGDYARKRVWNWEDFSDAQSSYSVVSPAAPAGDSNVVYLRCKLHGHLGYADATVFDGKRRRTKVLW